MKSISKYQNIVNFYKKSINTHGLTNNGIGWDNHKALMLRYKNIANIIVKSRFKRNFSLLDLGCGLSGLYLFLINKKFIFEYNGVDTSKKIISFCKKKFKKNNYYNCDILKDNKKIGTYDITILSGIFTIKNKLNNEEMYFYIFKVLKKIKKKTKGLIIINFLTDNPDWKNKKNFYPNYDILKKFIQTKISKKFYILNLDKIFEKIIVINLN